MGKGYLLKLNPGKFADLPVNRVKRAALASNDVPSGSYPANELAKRLHPLFQHVIVTKVTDEEDGISKSFFLMPDMNAGTTELAIFAAGQAIPVYVNINGINAMRPYSLSSSPKDALMGFYRITVKPVPGGIVSNYIAENWKIGTKVTIGAPNGHFTYVRLRDAENVVAVAGGSGITPFVSLAKAIVQGSEDAKTLTILYGTRKKDSVLLKNELDEIALASNGRVRVIYVLSDEIAEGFENGFVTASLIGKYAPDSYSLFISGPKGLFEFMDKEVLKLGLEKKYIRKELFGELYSPDDLEDYPGIEKEKVKITIHRRGLVQTFEASPKNTILRSLELAGIVIPSGCRSGECGVCHAHLDNGDVYIPRKYDGRRLADAKFGFIHPCCTYPMGDIEISV